MATQIRDVDRLPAPKRVDNIKIIAVGLSRTGTTSMYHALAKLGYRSYHMIEAATVTNILKGHLFIWNEALRAKHPDISKYPRVFTDLPALPPYTSPDFHRILQDYDAVADIPAIHFVPELLAAYPDARLILTTHPRGVDAWLRSMYNCFFRITGWSVWEWPLMRHDLFFSLPYMMIFRRTMHLWTGRAWPECGDYEVAEPLLREFYGEHVAEMRRLAAEHGRPLLEFDPRQGWAPLCEFLGKEVPDEPYPRSNEGESIVKVHRQMVYDRLMALYGTKLAVTAGVLGGLAVVGFAWWRRAGWSR